jgi:hypothetical protein
MANLRRGGNTRGVLISELHWNSPLRRRYCGLNTAHASAGHLVRGAHGAPLGVQCAQAADAQWRAAAAADATRIDVRVDNRAHARSAPAVPLAAVERRVLPGPRLASKVQQHWRRAAHSFRLGVGVRRRRRRRRRGNYLEARASIVRFGVRGSSSSSASASSSASGPGPGPGSGSGSGSG